MHEYVQLYFTIFLESESWQRNLFNIEIMELRSCEWWLSSHEPVQSKSNSPCVHLWDNLITVEIAWLEVLWTMVVKNFLSTDCFLRWCELQHDFIAFSNENTFRWYLFMTYFFFNKFRSNWKKIVRKESQSCFVVYRDSFNIGFNTLRPALL